MKNTALNIKNLTKKYDDFTAVDDLSLEIPQGEFFGFLGPNGAGKTTTINCITGVANFTKGEIEVYGTDVQQDYRQARKKIGLAPQEYNVDKFETVENILWFFGGYFGIDKETREERMEEHLDTFDLQPHREKQFRELSGGLKRRVMLARAMMNDPEFVIFDEPTAGVDVELRHELWKYLKKLNKEGRTIFLTSHYIEEIEALCERVGVINQGELVRVDKKEKLMENKNSLEEKYLELTQ
jgi:ABC-2 type transport system ATP-binding protein